MARVLYFPKKPYLQRYTLQGNRLELELNQNVFPPSISSFSLAKSMKINVGETVIDVGTGSGILAILAAKLGGIVYATDINNDALETAKRNAQRNKVKINFKKGNYFADFNKKFDVIISNLPQEIVPKSYQKAIGKKLLPSIYGGTSGNKKMIEFLKVAKNHMHKNSRIYTFIFALSDYELTIKKMLETYNTRLLNFYSLPTKEFVEDNIEMYLKLNKKGKIKIFQDRKKWRTYEFFFELTLK